MLFTKAMQMQSLLCIDYHNSNNKKINLDGDIQLSQKAIWQHKGINFK